MLLKFFKKWKERLKLLGKSTDEINKGSVALSPEEVLNIKMTTINTILNEGLTNKVILARIQNFLNIKDPEILQDLRGIVERNVDNQEKSTRIQGLISGNSLVQKGPGNHTHS